MPKTDHEEQISSDKPLQNPDGDDLGYAPLARGVANRIVEAGAPEGFVLAINAAWGFGKTSLLNMVVFYLNEKDANERPICVQFNPWWFSDREDLAIRFFDALQQGFGEEGTANTIRELLGSLGGLVGKLPLANVAAAGQIVERLALRPKPSIPDLKSRISEKLRELGRTIVVTIDDIDRLTFEEIRQVFRLIKAVGDFPNVVYLLAFDLEIVAKALSDQGDLEGKSYIEKIVQVPIHMPVLDRDALRRMFLSKLDRLVQGHDDELFDQPNFGNMFIEGIEPLLTTPRDATRLLNALRFTYPSVKTEVNLADFVAIEALRVFCPSVYELVRTNQEKFVRPLMYASRQPEESETLNSLLRPLNLEETQRETVSSMLERMFPSRLLKNVAR